MSEYQVQATNLPADAFLRGYLECVEWSGVSESTDTSWCRFCETETVKRDAESRIDYCETCDKDVVSDQEAMDACENPRWSDEALERARVDCANFQAACESDLEGEDEARAGHDFWLTRNHHGAGFWDGDYEKAKGERLTKAAEGFREVDVWFDHKTGLLNLE